MTKAISVDVKKRGRPATGTDPEISARVPRIIRDKIDAVAAKEGCTRSEAIRRLLEEALAKKPRQRGPQGG